MLDAKFEGLEQLTPLQRKLTATIPVFQAFAKYRRERFKDHLSKGQNPYGEAYAPLTASYAARKRSQVGDKPILQFSTKLVRGHRVSFSGDQYFESFDRYDVAGAHQGGTRAMPRRLLLPTPERGLPQADLTAFQRILMSQKG